MAPGRGLAVALGVVHLVGWLTRPSEALVTNRLLGTCLTDAWVKTVEKNRGINASATDALGRKLYPALHAAKTSPAFRINDPRTATGKAYDPSCVIGEFFGAGATVDPTTKKVVDRGQIDGALIVEFSAWDSHWLTSQVFSILASEVIGFPVAHFHPPSTEVAIQRLTSVGAGICNPVHVNLEVWTSGKEEQLQTYSNETFSSGAIGYAGLSGLYTTQAFIDDFGNTSAHATALHPAYWMSYRSDDNVINAVAASTIRNNSQIFPPKSVYCPDNVMGCLNHCAKTPACVDREAKGKECMVVAMMHYTYDRGYFQSVISNLAIPAYMCFLGYGGVEALALDAAKNNRPLLFYHYEPSLFHSDHPGIFERVFLPRATPARAVLTTGTYGENGYGKPTNNPVNVDFPMLRLAKYTTARIQGQTAALQLIGTFTIEELDIYNLQRMQTVAARDPNEENPAFRAACNWVQSNFHIWASWIERLPLCTFHEHVKYTVTGCDDPVGGRTITFAWKVPNPADATQPYECDGGFRLREPIRTSRSCEWIAANVESWQTWISAKPLCDATFYKYNVTDCGTDTKRTVKYWWLLPSPTKLDESQECTGGVALPGDVRIDCDYMPASSPVYSVLAAIAGILIVLQVLGILWVFLVRDKPIIKRSQVEFLMLLLLGGILVCLAAILYGGKPSTGLCAGRPITITMGFTIVFGSLFVKSLRVYRVFMKAALKRVTITVWMMFKVLGIFLAIDVVILATWFIADFPKPTVTLKPPQGFQGDVDRIQCKSGSFMFSALLIFWKAILLFMGLYISFLVRNVSADFQESVWIFASSVIVLVSCLFILPLAYMIEMAAAAFYVFLSATLLASTLCVMGMMFVPKALRLHEEGNKTSNSTTNGGASSHPPSVRPSHHGGHEETSTTTVRGNTTDETGFHDLRQKPIPESN